MMMTAAPDLSALISRAEAFKAAADVKNSAIAPIADQGKTERGRGRGGNSQVVGKGGRAFRGSNGKSGEGQYGYSSSKDWGSSVHGGRGHGHGRGRGRGRGHYEERVFGNESYFNNAANQAHVGGYADGSELQIKNNGYRANDMSGSENRNGEFGDENKNSEIDDKVFNGELQKYGIQGRRRFDGNNDRKGGVPYRVYYTLPKENGNAGAHRHAHRNGEPALKETDEAVKVKEDGAPKVQAVIVAIGDTGSGGDIAISTESAGAEVENANADSQKTKDELEAEEEAKKMTLAQYEKLLQEKRKVVEAMRTEGRKVVIDKEFERMQLVDKKRGDEVFVQLKMEKDKLKKKDSLEKEEKVLKHVSTAEFFNAAAYRRNRRGQCYHGQTVDGYNRRVRGSYVPKMDDLNHFPGLRQIAKA